MTISHQIENTNKEIEIIFKKSKILVMESTIVKMKNSAGVSTVDLSLQKKESVDLKIDQ